MPQIPFAFECERLNDLCMAELLFGCSEIFVPYFIENGQFVLTFQNKNIYIFECEWPNGNSNDLCTAELPFGCLHSNANANGN